MRNIKSILTVIFIFTSILLTQSLHGYNWPLKEFNEEHPITGTLCEYRAPSGNLTYHFHSGIDIAADGGTAVYSIVDGVVSEIGSQSVRIGQYRYYHITPHPNLKN